MFPLKTWRPGGIQTQIFVTSNCYLSTYLIRPSNVTNVTNVYLICRLCTVALIHQTFTETAVHSSLHSHVKMTNCWHLALNWPQDDLNVATSGHIHQNKTRLLSRDWFYETKTIVKVYRVKFNRNEESAVVELLYKIFPLHKKQYLQK
jgi:hypothetical protein